MPTIACVIPTHKRATLLAEALESIAGQTSVPDEVVVVSDCADAEAERVCADAAAASGLPIRFLHLPDRPGGASASRNSGVASTTSDFVALLDDDDRWEPAYLETALAELERTGADMVVTWITMVSETSAEPGPAIAPDLDPKRVVAMNRGSTGSNMVLTRASFDTISGFDEDMRVKNDTDFFYRYLKAGNRYTTVNQRLVLQTKHASGQLTGNTEMRARGNEIYMQKHQADLGIAERREIRMWIHYIRAHTAGSTVARAGHFVAAAFNVSPKKVFRVKQFRRMQRLTTVPGFRE